MADVTGRSTVSAAGEPRTEAEAPATDRLAEAAHEAAPGEYTIDDGEHTWKFEGAVPRAEGLDVLDDEPWLRMVALALQAPSLDPSQAWQILRKALSARLSRPSDDAEPAEFEGPLGASMEHRR